MQQAAILSLYDPDRSARFLENGKPTAKSWTEFDAYLKTLTLGDGSGLRFLSETVNSPSLMSVRDEALEEVPESQVGRVRSDSRERQAEPSWRSARR